MLLTMYVNVENLKQKQKKSAEGEVLINKYDISDTFNEHYITMENNIIQPENYNKL